MLLGVLLCTKNTKRTHYTRADFAAAVFTLSCKYFYEAIMAEDEDEDHGKRE